MLLWTQCRACPIVDTPRPANCSGLANSGVPVKAPGVEIAASAGVSGAGLASPRSMILAVTVFPSSTLTRENKG